MCYVGVVVAGCCGVADVDVGVVVGVYVAGMNDVIGVGGVAVVVRVVDVDVDVAGDGNGVADVICYVGYYVVVGVVGVNGVVVMR